MSHDVVTQSRPEFGSFGALVPGARLLGYFGAPTSSLDLSISSQLTSLSSRIIIIFHLFPPRNLLLAPLDKDRSP
ncbi:hypothetical protein HZ326_13602 [Fusarium oxysporum f. sp. albedinis]|nr:hypothetical protein HZ326_13602 [Fusarium oxysporum f. sp. albedinis]